MPYIKQEDREKYKIIIEKARHLDIGVARALLLDNLSKLHPTEVDGHLNFVFTKLLKDSKNNFHIYFGRFIDLILQDVYADPPKYYKLQRAIGLLTCMIIEFSRRKWSVQSKKFLKDLRRKFTENILIPYEDIKIEQNGDIE